jgi:hypothetical protein
MIKLYHILSYPLGEGKITLIHFAWKQMVVDLQSKGSHTGTKPHTGLYTFPHSSVESTKKINSKTN